MTTNESTEPSVSRALAFLRLHRNSNDMEDLPRVVAEIDNVIAALSPQPATSREAVGDWRKALKLARPIVEADISTAEGYADADWEGMSRTALEAIDAALTPAPADVRPVNTVQPIEGERKFQIGDRVTKMKGSWWTGLVVGTYRTALTPEGYAVESENEPGSVQIYPAAALASKGGVS